MSQKILFVVNVMGAFFFWLVSEEENVKSFSKLLTVCEHFCGCFETFEPEKLMNACNRFECASLHMIQQLNMNVKILFIHKRTNEQR